MLAGTLHRIRSIKATGWLLICALVIIVLFAGGFTVLRFHRPGQIVRIGVNHSPPYAIVGDNGSLSGFAVEVLKEAARRRRIQLQWIQVLEGSDKAFQSGRVDIWYLYTDFPERHKIAYFTDPWLRLKYALVVPKQSVIQKQSDTVGRRISYFSGPAEQRLSERIFQRSVMVRVQAGHELDAICSRSADAALIEIKSTVARLLNGPLGCGSVEMRLVPLQDASFQMAIGATQQGLWAARLLRSEISNMAQDGTLDRLHQDWFQFTSDETRVVNELMDSKERSQAFFFGAAFLAGVIVLLVALIRRERTAQRFTAAVIDNAGGLIVICDARGHIIQLNRACARLAGKNFLEIRGTVLWDVLVPASEREEVRSRFFTLAHGSGLQSGENHWHAPDGKRLFSWSNTALMNRSGRVAYIIGTGTDISSHEAEEQRLGYLASHDPLTGLGNRRYLLRELEGAISSAQDGGEQFCIAMADFDYFKLINDTYGHDAGDEVLTVFAGVLNSELSSRDLAARLGGDEFCLLIRSPNAEPLLDRIANRLNGHAFRAASGETFHARVTFGVTSWSGVLRQTADILRSADEALYQAKRRRLANESFPSEVPLVNGVTWHRQRPLL